MAASLDHSMWIHHYDFKIDEDWVLYETESTIGGISKTFENSLNYLFSCG
jgi:acyl-CoA thioesterase